MTEPPAEIERSEDAAGGAGSDGDDPAAAEADGDEAAPDPEEPLEALRFVGPVTADLLDEAGVDAADVRTKEVSYRDLIQAGTNPGVATKIRREHSLPWTTDGGDDLDQRSELVRGLRDGEREWVAQSRRDDDRERTGESEWVAESFDCDATEPAETDGSGTSEAAEAAWRSRSRRDPVETLPGIDEEEADLLSDAGAPTVRRLATGSAERLADWTGLSLERVEDLQAAARERTQ